ncbi:SLATT domain-containing protein [Mycobacterium sp. DL440]|uniref:SLATT domain-containing protein n=1 Tax=Mycobacterium sp. DL440 TaxID=2675523 RepID=UPI00142063D3|nr:SLATT domain-containing protein [Mycobacterium sp. DL440]
MAESTEETSAAEGSPELLLAQVRELYGRAAYTHKTHEKQADICYRKYWWQRRGVVAMTAVSSTTFVASLLGLANGEQWAPLVISFIALVVTTMNLGSKNFKHGEEMQQHRDTAAKVWDVRESYLSLIVDLQAGACSMQEGIARRNDLQKRYFAILGDAPRTTPKAYEAAQDGLKNREDLTFSESEIDQMLPIQLRQGKPAADEGK